MSLNVGELVANLRLDNGQFQRGLRESAASAARAGKSFTELTRSVEASAASQTAAAKRLAAAESQLDNARKSGKASQEELLRLEARVDSARASGLRATNALAASQRQLSSANQAAAASSQRATASIREQERASSSLQTVAGSLKKSLAFAGYTGGLLAVAGALKSSITAGMDFTNALNSMQAVSGATAAQIAQVSATARQLGTDNSLAATSSVDAANAMLELSKGGLTVQQSMQAARGTLQLAAAAQIDAASAATIQANALNAFGLKADYAGKAADILANTANQSSAEITDVALALQQSGTVAHGFGLSIQDTATMIGLFSNAGIKGSDAGTLLKTSLLALTDQGKPAQAAIKELGLTVYDSNQRFVGMRSLYEQLSDASKRMTQQQFQAATATLFGSDAIRNAMVASGGGVEAFDKMRAAMERNGAAAEVAAAKMKGLPGAWENLKNNAQEAALTVYDAVKGPLTSATNLMAEQIEKMVSRAKSASASLGQALNDPNTKAQLQELGDSTRGTISELLSSLATLGPSVGTIVASLARASAALGVGGWQLLLAALQAATGVLNMLDPLLSTTADLMQDNQVAVTALLAAWVAFKTVPTIANRVSGAVEMIGTKTSSARSSMASFSDQMALQQRLAAMNGVEIGRMGSAIAVLGTRSATVSSMSDAFYRASTAASVMSRTTGVLSASMTGLRAAGSNVAALFGGPLGVALAAAGVAMAAIATQNGEAKAQQEAYTQAAKGSRDAQVELNAALLATRGVVTSDVMSKLTDSVSGLRAELDATANHTTNGFLSGDWFPGQDSTNDKLKRTAEQAQRANSALDSLGLTNENIARLVNGSQDAFDAQISKLRSVGDGGALAATKLEGLRAQYNQTVEVARRTAPGFHEAEAAVEKFSDATASAADKADALKAAMDAMNPARTAQDATARYAETVDQISQSLGDAVDQAQGFGNALVQANGSIDTFTGNGAKLHTTLKGLADSSAEVAANGGDMGRVNQENEQKFAALAQQYGVSMDRIRAAYQALGGNTIDLTMHLRGADTTAQQLGLVYTQLSQLQPGQPKVIEVRAGDLTPQTQQQLKSLGFQLETINRNGVQTIRISSTAAAVGNELERLGIQTEQLPDGHVKISDNSPDVMQKLADVGVKTETLPDGSVVIKASDSEFWAAMQKITAPAEKRVTIIEQTQPNLQAPGLVNPFTQGHSEGGWTGPGSKYQPAGIVHADEFVINKESRRQIERENPGALDYANQTGQLPLPLAGYADGGRVGGLVDVYSLARYMRGIETGHYVRGGWGDGWNTDCSGGQSIAMNGAHGNMQPGTGERSGTAGFPTFVVKQGMQIGQAPANTPALEVGWSSEHSAGSLFGANSDSVNFEMGGGMDTESHSDGKYNGQVGSRHSQFPNQAWIGLPGGDGMGAGGIKDVNLTPNSSREDVARKIISEGRKRGYSDGQITAILSAALQESNLTMAEGGGGAWHGYFQQDGSYPGRDDPNTNITGFYDRLDEKKNSPGWDADDIYSDIFWVQQAPGAQSADVAVSQGRQGYLVEIKSHESEASQLLQQLSSSVGYTNSGGGNGDDGSGGEDGGSKSGQEAPEDPKLFEFTIQNPFEPFWWKGEKEYRQHIIDDEKKREKWNDWINGTGDYASKGTKGTRTKVKSLAEAEEDLKDAREALAIAEQRQRELKPNAKESARMSAQRTLEKAQQRVKDAEEEVAEAKKYPSGYKVTPKNGFDGDDNPNAQHFSVGGTVQGAGSGDTVATMLEPGEEVVRRGIAERPGVRAFLKKLNAGQLQHFADGGTAGFGGYTDDDSDSMAPKNWYDWIGLASGAAFTAYNAVDPYIQMVMSGQVDLSKVTPTLSTNTTDTPYMSSVVSDLGGQISKQIQELIWAVKDGKNIHVTVTSPNAPQQFNEPRIAAGKYGV